ncbi:MAG: GNAT family N-acetyltransferase [Dehalococcoidia bacterium]|nr:GNAT family N-acetyltransferase [Dehalococcoidia bacterium]
MTRPIELRRANEQDADDVAAIARSLEGTNTALAKNFDAERARQWIKRLGDSGVMILAVDGSIPVAFGTLDFDTSEPETGVLGVWVAPEHRRRGLATDIAEELVEFAREHGYRRIRGRLPDGNEPALSFLSSIGAMVPLRNPNMSFELPF